MPLTWKQIEDTAGSQAKASAAQAFAESTASVDATLKANAAKESASSAASDAANAKASASSAASDAANAATSASSAVETASTDATLKASAAQASAESTASADATLKANAAKASASSAASDAANAKASASSAASDAANAATSASSAHFEALTVSSSEVSNRPTVVGGVLKIGDASTTVKDPGAISWTDLSAVATADVLGETVDEFRERGVNKMMYGSALTNSEVVSQGISTLDSSIDSIIEIKNKLGALENVETGEEILTVLATKPNIHIDIAPASTPPADVNKGDRGIDSSGNNYVAVTAP